MDFKNVRETWEIHDTLCVCQTLYGTEANAGFFTSFVNFGQQQEHLFFKRRSEGNVHRAYNNMQAEDRADFVFHAFTVGLLFYAPCTPYDTEYDAAAPTFAQDYLPSFWTGELPRHCSAALKIGQDTNLLAQGMMLSPGYGPVTSGAALGADDTGGATDLQPEFIWTTVQGLPMKAARFYLPVGDPSDPKPIGIPKGDLFELRLKVSEHARNILQQAGGPRYYYLGQTGEALNDFFPTRYGIQATLYGMREVQQRGELRA